MELAEVFRMYYTWLPFRVSDVQISEGNSESHVEFDFNIYPVT